MTLMDRRAILISVRLIVATLIFTAVAAQIAVTVQAGAFQLFNFFGYFTILSNLFAGLVLLISAFYLAGHRKPSPQNDILRGASVLYMAVTGLVYVTLLSQYDLDLTLPWVNFVLHFVAPVFVVADWFYQPPVSRLQPKQVATWLVFPAAYLVYSLVRGTMAHWYPYPFLSPEMTGGYGGVALYCIGILAGLFAISWVLAMAARLLKRRVL